jgi:hypothetical protein
MSTSQKAQYKCIAGALVAENPQNKGVIEFYGGAFFELLPQVSYEYYLQGLFNAGYTIIAVPFAFSFDHMEVALGLIEKRDNIRAALKLPKSSREFPHFWIGHSVGCKIISLLEVLTDVPRCVGIADEPSLLLAPDISDTSSAVPWPISSILDLFGLGVKPTQAQTQRLIAGRTDVFTLAGLISFADDDIAGNAAGTLPKKGDSNVKWFVDTLSERDRIFRRDLFLHQELPGGHLAPIGFQFGNCLVDADPAPIIQKIPRINARNAGALDQIVQQSLTFLEALRERIPTQEAIATRLQALRAAR